MKYCSSPHCRGRQQNDKLAEYHDSVEVCPQCGASLTPKDRLVHKPPTSLWSKAFISLGVLAVCLVARQVALPTVTLNLDFADGRMAGWSIMALGVRPLILGYILVEFAALIVPAWRPLRVGGPAGRAKLHRAALITGMVIALPQACVMTFALETMDVTRNYGGGFRVITVLTLLGATGALVALARIVDREGLGSGFSVLLLAELVPQIVAPLGSAYWKSQLGAIPFSVFLDGNFVAAVLAGATLWMFSPFRLPASDHFPHPALVSRPACGVAPFTTVAAMLGAAAAWTRMNTPGHPWGPEPFSSNLPTALFLGVGAAMFFAFLFNRPDKIVQTWKCLSPNPPEGIPYLKAVMLESVLFIILVVLAEAWAVQRIGNYAANTVAVLLATGIVCDLVREWRAREADPHLTPVWEIHQTYAVTPTMRMLEAEGIHAFAKGARLRALLQFFGPYVPVQIQVPAKDAQRAQALLQLRWPRADGDGSK